MKVIEKKAPPVWSLQVVCVGATTLHAAPGCGSKLEVEASDLSKLTVYEYGKAGRHVATFKCSVCGEHSDLKESDIPAWVFTSLKVGPDRGNKPYAKDYEIK